MNENNEIHEIILNPIDIYFLITINDLLHDSIKKRIDNLVKVFTNDRN